MQLVKFRIKNYKSITDSGDCYLSDAITILAGKNESGKTSILEALNDFNINKTIPENTRPIKDSKALPQITIFFKINTSLIKDILEKNGIKTYLKDATAVLGITKYLPNKYAIDLKSLEDSKIFNPSFIEKRKEYILRQYEKLKPFFTTYPALGAAPGNITNENILTAEPIIKSYKETLDQKTALIHDAEARKKFSNLILELIQLFIDIANSKNIPSVLCEGLKPLLPNFILFNSFEDIFPNQVPIAELKTNPWTQDLSIISDLDPDIIAQQASQLKYKHKTDINISIKEDYSKFWTQDAESHIAIDWNSTILEFWIIEDNYPYTPHQRSKGRQWHLAFYIKVSARAMENKLNILLIDEPGLFLHGAAQKDILKKLEVSAQDAQIIFSTHSPYLLEPDKFDRIRLVDRTDKSTGTKIHNKIHALADKETLTPLLTAIGLELTSGIINVDKKSNVVVEGISDIYYLQALKNILDKDNINFIFGGGAGNMPFVGTILHGWGCNVIYLYDNDRGKRDGEKNLKNTWLISDDLIVPVLGEKNKRIEDIFCKADFSKLILQRDKVNYICSNSEFIGNPKNKIDKVLHAKEFLDKTRSNTISLSSETLKNATQLFDNLTEKFKNIA
ncbi:MAG: ATP-binding protein [Deltaproteobacteria bacterium]|nr:ATP-binding protein [Deltaproteobacteria bacterium]